MPSINLTKTTSIEPAREPYVQAELNSLKVILNDLSGCLPALKDKLSPVLYQGPFPQNPEQTTPKEDASKPSLVFKIRELRDNAEASLKEIQDILARIEV